jgi:hypothetical protein
MNEIGAIAGKAIVQLSFSTGNSFTDFSGKYRHPEIASVGLLARINFARHSQQIPGHHVHAERETPDKLLRQKGTSFRGQQG